MSYLNLLVCTMCLFLKNSLLCLNKDVCFIWAWIAYVVWMGWNWKRMGDSGDRCLTLNKCCQLMLSSSRWR